MSFQTKEIYQPDQLVAFNGFPTVGGVLKVAKGVVAKRGALLTAEGKVCTKASGKVDDVYAVLVDDVDATSNPIEVPVYLTGAFSKKAVSFTAAESVTVEDFAVSARKVGIFLVAVY